MDKYVIRGGLPLRGTVMVSGAKNAVLPAMAAALLTDEPVRLANVPRLKDVETMANLLRWLGARVESHERALTITASGLANPEAPYDLVRTMRASFVVLGPLLARLRRARVSLPGGCAIGTRPINLHLRGLAALGASIDIHDGYVEARAERLRGADIVLDSASVGATENLMMAASLAEGETVISNAAREPEVVDLAELLRKMGANIRGVGSDTITITGVRQLKGADHSQIPDRIEAGTYLVLSLLTGGEVKVRGVRREHLHALEARLYETGAVLREEGQSLSVTCSGTPRAVDALTAAYPGFPTDMQAQWMVLMAVANGSSVIQETVFENRFQHVPELVRMGANISVKGGTAVVRGGKGLRGAPVMVSDLRAGAALVLAGLVAEGVTEVHRIYHLDRGYERLEDKLRALGASIERIPGPAI